jgi:plasmid replication initiation protein
MAIKICVDENEWVEFFPEYAGNLDQPKKERVSCMIRYITQEDQDRLTDLLIGDSRKGFRSQKSVKWSKAHNDMINNHVKDIKNVSIVRAGKEEPIKNMAEMYKIPHLKDLYREIGEALDASSRLEDFETKN